MLRSARAKSGAMPDRFARSRGGRGLDVMWSKSVSECVIEERGCHTVSHTRRTFVLEDIAILNNRAEGRERLPTVASDRREER